MLTRDPDERLSGLDVKGHPFFDPISGLWAEIAALKYPPCPNTPTPCVVEDLSADFEPPLVAPQTWRSSYTGEPQEENCTVVEGARFLVEDSGNPFGLYSEEEFELPLASRGNGRTVIVEREPNNSEGSDNESLVQALPSSTSIWLNWELEEAHHISRGEVSDLNLNITTEASQAILDSTQRKSPSTCFVPYFPSRLDSPFSLELNRLEISLDPSVQDGLKGFGGNPAVDSHSPFSEHSFSPRAPEQVLQEEITISLLEAMDNRDRRSSCRHWWVDTQVPKSKEYVATNRILLKTTAKWIWRKLQFR